MHLNVKSLVNKIDEIRNLTSSINPAVFGFSETWLDETITDDEIKIQGYVLERKDRNRLGGGVCAYIREDLAYNRRFDMETPDLEVLPIDLFYQKLNRFSSLPAIDLFFQ